LRQNFRLAALRSIAQDKREALKRLQEMFWRAQETTRRHRAGAFGPSLQDGGSNALGYIRLKDRNVGTISRLGREQTRPRRPRVIAELARSAGTGEDSRP
ncbi:unnamed protein product, partial [Ectocarpus sp. 12 AP-2014]